MNILDLFAGAGGFSLGFEYAGFHTKYAVEKDKFAAETFSKNFKSTKVFHKSVTDFNDQEIQQQFQDIDLIIGGPPCQGFSVAGPRQYGIEDKRNELVLEMLRYSEVLRPKICLIENVPGLARKTNNNTLLKKLLTEFEKIGYQCQILLLDSKNFGVPQSRKRCFLLFTRNNNLPISFLNDAPLFSMQTPQLSVQDAISDLDFEDLPNNDEIVLLYQRSAETLYQNWARLNSSQIFNHVPMMHTQRLIERFKVIKQGQSLKDVPSEYGQRNRETHLIDKKNRFKMNNQRLNPNTPSLAVTASFQSNFVHPHRHRNLTAREGARLMSYPDSFRFFGPRTLMSKALLIREGRENEIGLSQYNQIGNSVPPLLAKAIANALIEHGF